MADLKDLSSAMGALLQSTVKLTAGIAGSAGLATVLTGLLQTTLKASEALGTAGTLALAKVLGTLTDKAIKLGEVLSRVLMRGADVATAGLIGLSDRLGRLAEVGMKSVGKSIDLLYAPIKSLSGAMSAFGESATGVVSGLQSAFGPIVDLVGKINPALAEQFAIVMDDLAAVFGEIMLPIVKAVIPLIRKLADTVRTMRPAFEPIIGVIVEIVGIIGQLIKPIAKIVTPLIQLIGHALQALMPLIRMLVNVVLQVANAVQKFINMLIDAYNKLVEEIGGKKIKKFDDMSAQSSVGAAIRQTSFMGGEELGKQARANAFKGTGAKTPEEKATDEVGKKVAETNSILEFIAKNAVPGMKGTLEIVGWLRKQF